ncbi:carbohydrate ABC transporter permease [Cohnella cellulosilytica]|uniref:Carbohydrate ABC transporter permease n=1 Tax=Cohnella cellulosilytica TaxID=986710 RepID=A0ABW2FDT1_9BACL
MKALSIRNALFHTVNILFILFVIAAALLPFLNVLATSFSSSAAVIANKVTVFPVDFSLDTYATVFDNPYIWGAYRNTILYTVLFVCSSIVLTTLAAYPLSKRGLLFRKIIMFYIVFTMIFSGGLIPLYLVVKAVGLINSMWAVILPYSLTVFSIMLLRTFFESLPVELEEAAKIDGMGDLGIMLKVFIPLAVPIYATLVLIFAIDQWNSFFPALLYLNHREMYPLQMVLRDIVLIGNMDSYREFTEDVTQLPVTQSLKAATIIVVITPIIMIYPFLQKYFMKGMMIGAVKG